jgi:hypothetical protein
MLILGIEVFRSPSNFGKNQRREFMSDGNEERHESRVRLEQERRENLEDRIHTDDVADGDDGEPERPDS